MYDTSGAPLVSEESATQAASMLLAMIEEGASAEEQRVDAELLQIQYGSDGTTDARSVNEVASHLRHQLRS